jgi:hypothetical protein
VRIAQTTLTACEELTATPARGSVVADITSAQQPTDTDQNARTQNQVTVELDDVNEHASRQSVHVHLSMRWFFGLALPVLFLQLCTLFGVDCKQLVCFLLAEVAVKEDLHVRAADAIGNRQS